MRFLHRVARFLEACKQIQPGPLGEILEAIWLCWVFSEEEILSNLQNMAAEINRVMGNAIENFQKGAEHFKRSMTLITARWKMGGQKIRIMADKVGKAWCEKAGEMRDL